MEVRELSKYDDLIKRLNDYSATKQCHGGITAEAADAISELVKRCEVYEDAAAYWKGRYDRQ